MNCSIKSIEIRKNTLFNEVNGKVLYMPRWQRTYDWKPETAHKMIREIIATATAPADKRADHVTFIGNAIIFNDPNNNNFVIADGHSRMITYTLIFKALNDLCVENGYNLCIPTPCGVCYKLDVANNAYTKFLRNSSSTTTYSKVYMYAYDLLKKFISSEKRAIAVLDTMMNYVYMGFQECDSKQLAHKSFVQLNCGGENMSKVEAASSLIQYAMEEWEIELEYDYIELAVLVEAYYYWKSCHDIAPSFSIAVMTHFIENNITNSRENMYSFGEFIDNIARYKDTSWFKLAKILGPKTVALTYVLAGKGCDLTGKDAEVNSLMTSLVVFDIACLARHANNGASTSGYFCDIKKQIGCGVTLSTINNDFMNWAKDHNDCYGDTFDEFAKSLDTLNDDYQKAILWFVYMKHNANSVPVNIAFEHSYPGDYKQFWLKKGWPTNPNEQKQMLDSLGNKILLDAETNRKLGNAFISDKKDVYVDFYNKNAAYKYSENYFDGERFENEKKTYLDERRNAYARVLANTDMGKILIG